MIDHLRHLLLPSFNWREYWEDRDFQIEENRNIFTQTLSLLVELFHKICIHDEEWNSAVARGTVEYAESDERNLFEEYRHWLHHADPLAATLKNGLEAGFSFPQTAAFQKCLEAARGVCTDDAEFFSGDELTELRDAAIESHRRGETDKLLETGD